MRFAANLSMLFAEKPFPERFMAAARAGFDCVEFLFPYAHAKEDIAHWARAAGVEIALFNAPPGLWEPGERGLAALAGRAGEYRAGLDTALDYAAHLGVKRLHVMAGIAPAGDPRARALYLDNLALAAKKAAPFGITILIEPLNGRDMPGYFLNDFNAAAQIIGEIGADNLKLQFDIYHRQILHGDVITGISDLAPITGHVQVASVPGRAEPLSGELDEIAVFKALKASGYRGVIGCEYRPRTTSEAGLGWLARARAAIG